MLFGLGIATTIIGLLSAVFGSVFIQINLGLVGLVLFGNTSFLLGVFLIVVSKIQD